MKEYVVKIPYLTERLGYKEYKAARQIASKFEASEGDDFCGNLAMEYVVDTKTKELTHINWKNRDFERHDSVSCLMPSGMWLYRLMCLYQLKVESLGPAAYKLVWSTVLLHKETGIKIMFYEWKGAFTFGVQPNLSSKVPKKFKQDLLKLLRLLASNEIPHPYDGTVAGSVA